MSKIVVLRFRMRMLCWKKSDFTFRKFSSTNIPSISFGRLWLFNSLQSLIPLFIFVGLDFDSNDLGFSFSSLKFSSFELAEYLISKNDS